MFPLLMRLVEKTLGKVFQSLIVTVKAGRDKQADVGGDKLQVDLAVAGGLGGLVVVPVYLPGGRGHASGRVAER